MLFRSEALADSDLTVVVLDAAAGFLAEDQELLDRSRSAGASLLVWNKVDLAPPAEELEGAWRVSALTGQGIAELRRAIVDKALPGLDGSRETGFLTNIRHERLIREALEALKSARIAVEGNIPHEMLLLDLYAALRPIDAITGATTADDILNRIFATFCIGK